MKAAYYVVIVINIIFFLTSTKCAEIQGVPQIQNPTMVSLVNHHRLLGFIPMMDEPMHHLNITPWQPTLIGTKFLLFDRNSIGADGVLGQGDEVKYLAIQEAYPLFRGKYYDKLYFVTHDFMENFGDIYKQFVIDLLRYRGFERPVVIFVDWNKGAMLRNPTASSSGDPFMEQDLALFPELVQSVYGQAVVNTVVVGREIAVLNVIMTTLNIISKHQVHYIGLGLGAQVMHVAGKWYTYMADRKQAEVSDSRIFSKIGRITGLDPSARDFQGYGTATKIPYLNSQDAEFVDIIHTSAVKKNGNKKDIKDNRFGMSVLSGHLDFYPNGGQKQPYCIGKPKCSHQRALHYFSASLYEADMSGTMLAVEASSYQEYVTMRTGKSMTFFGRLFKRKKKPSGSFLMNYMGIQAEKLDSEPSDIDPSGYFLDIALDDDLLQVVTKTSGRSKLKLVDTLKPPIVSKEGFDFSLFPVHNLSLIQEVELDGQDRPGCGRFLAPPNSNARVHFGVDSYVGQFPWNVCIAKAGSYNSGKTYVISSCTGALITEEFVITAAHCLKSYSKDTDGPLELLAENRPMHLMFGIDCRRPVLRREVLVKQDVTVFIHPGFSKAGGTGTKTDVALIKLPLPVPADILPVDGQYTSRTKLNTVCWRSVDRFNYLDICELLYFAGYGINDELNKTQSNTLRWTVMNLKRKLPRALIETTVIAVNAEDHILRNTCPGDSGGPLTQMVKVRGAPNQLYDQVSPYTARVVATVIGGSSPCNYPKKTAFNKVGHQAVYTWIDAILTNFAGPLRETLKPGAVHYDVREFLSDY
ncbi:Pancreatic lipase-related protein 2 [Halotydeus destructor]|nr:Pancreatic lipase-related protein 2 [Halotydeus destructor]